MLDLYRTVMDSEKNPLRHLPPVQRFQGMVVLSLMWAAIFCAFHEIANSKAQGTDRQGFSSLLFACSALGTSYVFQGQPKA